jgi:hypothetical protein
LIGVGGRAGNLSRGNGFPEKQNVPELFVGFETLKRGDDGLEIS